jgi:hypothetical protein
MKGRFWPVMSATRKERKSKLVDVSVIAGMHPKVQPAIAPSYFCTRTALNLFSSLPESLVACRSVRRKKADTGILLQWVIKSRLVCVAGGPEDFIDGSQLGLGCLRFSVANC